MELCRETLGDYLESRNKKYYSNSFSNNFLVNKKTSLRFSNSNLKRKSIKDISYLNQIKAKLTGIDSFAKDFDEIYKTSKYFMEILQGVKWIHDKKELIHRDLKPNNIFFR